MTDDKLKINCAPLLERITICGASISDITSLLSNSLNKIEQIKTLSVKILEDYRSNLIPDSEKENQYVSHIPNVNYYSSLISSPSQMVCSSTASTTSATSPLKSSPSASSTITPLNTAPPSPSTKTIR